MALKFVLEILCEQIFALLLCEPFTFVIKYVYLEWELFVNWKPDIISIFVIINTIILKTSNAFSTYSTASEIPGSTLPVISIF